MKPRRIYFVLLLTCTFFVPASFFSQNSASGGLDSLLKLLPSAKDTDRINLENEIGLAYLWERESMDTALMYSVGALKKARISNYAPAIAQSYLNFGIVSTEKGNYLEAIEQYKMALTALREHEKNNLWAKLLAAEIYNNMAHTFGEQLNYTKAVDYYLKSLRVFEPIAEENMDRFIAHVNAKGENTSKETITIDFINSFLKKNPKDKVAKDMITLSHRVLADIRYTCSNISRIFMRIEDYSKAVEYLEKGVKIAEDVQADDSYMELTIGIADAFFVRKNYDMALSYFSKVKKRAAEKKNSDYLLISNDGMARAFGEKGDFDQALAFYDTLYAMLAPVGDRNGTGLVNYQRAGLYAKQGQTEKALSFYKDAWQRFSSTGINDYNAAMCNWKIGQLMVQTGKTAEGIRLMEETLPLVENQNPLEKPNFYKNISEAYEKNKDIGKAFFYYKQYVTLSDSINSKLKMNAISELQKRFEVEKKDGEIELLNKDNDKQAVEIEKQKTVRNLIIGGLSIVLILGAVVTRSLHLNQKKNKLITEQKNEMEKQKLLVEKQRDLVEQKQQEMFDSLQYAQRIQHALLASEKYIQRNLVEMKQKKKR